MKQSGRLFKFVCEKTKTGWSAFVVNIEDGASVATTFRTIEQMHRNCLEVLNFYLEDLDEYADIENIIFSFEGFDK